MLWPSLAPFLLREHLKRREYFAGPVRLRYRFPEGKPPVAELSEAVDILQEFEAGLGCEPAP